MKNPNNINSISELDVDYMGFIFYENSPRLAKTPVRIPHSIQKVGVFVDDNIEDILNKVIQFGLNVIQLHGHEAPAFCKDLRRVLDDTNFKNVKLWKVFSIKSSSDFENMEVYSPLVDAYLLDTKGRYRGGNGKKFDWELLNHYRFQKPVMLSGGIGPEDAEAVVKLYQKGNIQGVDVNSGFEDEPGLKNKNRLEKFINTIRTYEHV